MLIIATQSLTVDFTMNLFGQPPEIRVVSQGDALTPASPRVLSEAHTLYKIA